MFLACGCSSEIVCILMLIPVQCLAPFLYVHYCNCCMFLQIGIIVWWRTDLWPAPPQPERCVCCPERLWFPPSPGCCPACTHDICEDYQTHRRWSQSKMTLFTPGKHNHYLISAKFRSGSEWVWIGFDPHQRYFSSTEILL